MLAGVYDDLLFHLGAATRPRTFFTNTVATVESDGMLLRRRVASWIRRQLPKRLRRSLSPLRATVRLYDQRPREQNELIFSEIRSELFTDPDRFLDQAVHDRG